MAGGHSVVIGAGALKALEARLAADGMGRAFILCDENTLRHCLPELLAQVPALRAAEPIAIRAGEGSKSLEVCQELWAHLLHREADRRALLVNLGGGVVSDVGGFVAGAYKRGIACINVPTTLMAQVDAAIGGKTGVDLRGVKNVVGLFHDPLAVYVHVPFLRSLGKRELLNGVAEMIKHGLVRDAAHWQAVAEAPLHDIDALVPLVARSAAIKAEIVSADPQERNLRRLLNFGHTIGHGLEAHSWESPQRMLLHGEAVAIGMICEAWLSWRLDLLDRATYDRIAALLVSLYKPYPLSNGDHHRIIELMRNDKKNDGGAFRFTLLTAAGAGRVDVPVTAAQVQEALDHYRLMVRDAARPHDPEA